LAQNLLYSPVAMSLSGLIGGSLPSLDLGTLEGDMFGPTFMGTTRASPYVPDTSASFDINSALSLNFGLLNFFNFDKMIGDPAPVGNYGRFSTGVDEILANSPFAGIFGLTPTSNPSGGPLATKSPGGYFPKTNDLDSYMTPTSGSSPYAPSFSPSYTSPYTPSSGPSVVSPGTTAIVPPPPVNMPSLQPQNSQPPAVTAFIDGFNGNNGKSFDKPIASAHTENIGGTEYTVVRLSYEKGVSKDIKNPKNFIDKINAAITANPSLIVEIDGKRFGAGAIPAEKLSADTHIKPALEAASVPVVKVDPLKPDKTLTIGGVQFAHKKSDEFGSNFTNSPHYYIEASREEGERAIAELTRNAGTKEEAWFFVRYRDAEGLHERWFEVGTAESNLEVTYDDAVLKALESDANVTVLASTIYHDHPLQNGTSYYEPPSIADAKDKGDIPSAKKFLQEHPPTPARESDYRVIVGNGVYVVDKKFTPNGWSFRYFGVKTAVPIPASALKVPPTVATASEPEPAPAPKPKKSGEAILPESAGKETPPRKVAAVPEVPKAQRKADKIIKAIRDAFDDIKSRGGAFARLVDPDSPTAADKPKPSESGTIPRPADRPGEKPPPPVPAPNTEKPKREEVNFTHSKDPLWVNTDDTVHYSFVRSRADGEADLRTLLDTATLEEGWIYLKGKGKDGKDLEGWYEIAQGSTDETATLQFDAVLDALKDFMSVSALSIYHIHPRGADGENPIKSETPSELDLEGLFTAMVYIENVVDPGTDSFDISKASFDYRIITPFGSYELRPDFKMFKGDYKKFAAQINGRDFMQKRLQAVIDGGDPVSSARGFSSKISTKAMPVIYTPLENPKVVTAAAAESVETADADAVVKPADPVKFGGDRFAPAPDDKLRINKGSHEYVNASENEGVEAIRAFTKTGNVEEAWYYIAYTDKEGVAHTRWFECGINQRGGSTGLDDDFLTRAIKDKNIDITRIAFYHNHPLEDINVPSGKLAVQFNPPSKDDLDVIVDRERAFTKAGYSGPFDFYAVTHYGVFGMRVPEDADKGQLQRAISSYNIGVGGKSSLEPPTESVEKIRSMGFSCSFEYYDPGVGSILEDYAKIYPALFANNKFMAQTLLGDIGARGFTIPENKGRYYRSLKARLADLSNELTETYPTLKDMREFFERNSVKIVKQRDSVARAR